MGNRGWGILLTLSLGLAVLTKGGPPEQAHAEPARTDSSQPLVATAAPNAHEAAPSQKEQVSAACRDGDQMILDFAELYGTAGSRRPFRYLVALVPDPEESGHTDYFDAVLEGIEDAAAREGSVDFWNIDNPDPRRYVRDRYWLPWSSHDPDKRKRQCWRHVPGVIIYRPVKGAPEPALAVLLVGETPTWGVRAQVLRAALERADNSLFDPAPPAAAPTDPPAPNPAGRARKRWYRILGPTFSGTAPSLRASIERHVEGRAKATAEKLDATFRIASGTATGEEVPATLRGGLEMSDAQPPTDGSTPTLTVIYESAVPTYARLLDAMLRFLDEAGGRSALLSEGGTAYGESPQSAASAGLTNDGGHRLLHGKFPPNLTSLRKAYLEVLPSSTDGKALVTRAPSDVRVAPAEAQGELSEQTPIAHDLALAEVLRDFGQENIRNIGISATDARDVIFIAERVGRQLPDVRLFTIGYDIRYLHPEHARALNGMLVAHAAPPPPRPWWATATKNPLTAQVSAAGQFLLTNTRPTPFARVSLIGNGSIRRITVDRGPEQELVVAPTVPRSFRIIYALTLIVLSGALLLMTGSSLARHLGLRGNPDSERGRRRAFLEQRVALWTWSHRIEHPDLAADDSFATAALVSVVASAVLMMTAASMRLEERGALYAVTGAALGLVLVAWRPCFHRARQAAPSAIALGTLISTTALATTSLGCSKPQETTVWLLSGGSPLVGGVLGLSMLLVVAWCWRAQLRSLDLLCLDASKGSRFETSHGPIARALGHDPGEPKEAVVRVLERRFLRVLHSPWRAAPLIPLLTNAGVLAGVAVIDYLRPMLTFEPGFRHWVLLGLGVACFLCITTYFARLIVTSRALLGLLRAAASPELLSALARLPKELKCRLEAHLVSGARWASELKHPVHALHVLAEADASRAAAAADCAEALDAQLRYEAGIHLAGKSRICPADLVDHLLGEAYRLCQERAQQAPAVRALADDYRAILVTIFVGRYVRQLRSMAPPVLVGSALAILMTSLYFVQPRHLIGTTCFVWVTAMVLMIVASYISLARDALISAIGGTDAGSVQLSWGLAARVGAVTVVPLAGLIASQYPEFAFWISSLFGSLVQFVQ
jgi:hypothetical protein